MSISPPPRPTSCATCRSSCSSTAVISARPAATRAPRAAFHKLAANLATQFIKIGARAVVAAGWEVDDAAAKTFATVVLSRDAARRAVRRRSAAGAQRHLPHARRHQYLGRVPVLRRSVVLALAHRRSSARDDGFVSEAELGVWLDDIAARARDAVGREREQALVTQLELRETQVPAGWWGSADMCARAARRLRRARPLRTRRSSTTSAC